MIKFFPLSLYLKVNAKLYFEETDVVVFAATFTESSQPTLAIK